MKILSVNNTGDVYGASRCMERVFGRFAQEGHEVHAVLAKSGPLVGILEAKGVHVHIHRGLPIFDRSGINSLKGILSFLVLFPISVIRLSLLSLRLGVDVIHTNTVVLPSPGVAAFLTRKPHVWHVRELMGEFPALWRPYQRYMSFFSTAIIAISECVRDQFSAAYQHKVHVIYDGLDETISAVDPVKREAFRASFPANKLMVAVVGRIKWHRKGQEVLIQAAALLKDRHPDVHYLVVGTTSPGNYDHERRLRELVVNSGLENDVTFTGDVHEPITLFSAIDVAVAPSVQTEPFGCVVSEAMSVGTPVVGSGNGGIAEQIVDGVSGLLFTPGDPAALAEALDTLLSDPVTRKRIGDGGMERVLTAFQLEGTYLAMLALFEEVTQSGLKQPVSNPA